MSIELYIYPGSPKTKLCRLVGSGILYRNHPKNPFFVWSWTPRVYVGPFVTNSTERKKKLLSVDQEKLWP